jgi:acyl transferase domain-containing protein
VSGKEAEAMDPQQRMLLETVYEALENAGITLDEIRGTRTSVFCGAFTTSNDYHALQGKDLEYYPKYAITGSGNAILSNRISYFYNLHGPSMTVDTGCSSSLVCFHLGAQSLLNGEADISIIVGSALHFVPNTYQTMSDMGFISSDGRCHSFDAAGSGYVRGDGICAVVLKRYDDALHSQDRIRAVVRGTAVNHDGKTDGITLPSPEAQEALIRATYRKAGLDPDGTQYFEV